MKRLNPAIGGNFSRHSLHQLFAVALFQLNFSLLLIHSIHSTFPGRAKPRFSEILENRSRIFHNRSIDRRWVVDKIIGKDARIQKPKMKLVTATILSLALLAPASAQPKSKPGAAPTTTMPTQTIAVTQSGSQFSQAAPTEYFTGAARISPLPPANEPSRLGGASVSFQAGARTNWHTHPLGQTLIVTQGIGRVQSVGDPIQEMRTGDVVQIPPGVKHWHGAAPGSTMTHVALSESQGGKAVDWLERVSDAQYAAPQKTAVSASATQQKPSQKAIGDFAPKLAELTDNVLYGDIWERPLLSKRDRSLATVSALIALNRPDQLRSHFGRARDNGVTQEELIETITHLAFYAGWPSAVSAVAVAREVFDAKSVTQETQRSKPEQASTPATRTKMEQELLSLSRNKWRWMSERDVDALDALFHEEAVFVHMGATMSKNQELDTIRSGAIQYKNAEIQEASVRFIGNTAIVLNRIRLVAVVGGNEVTNPFVVTEVYVFQDGNWKLGSLSFTRLLGA